MEALNEQCKLNSPEMCSSAWHTRYHPQPRPTHHSFSTGSLFLLEPTKVPCLYPLMCVVHSVFFSQQRLLHYSKEEEEEGYSFTSASQFLLTDMPGLPFLMLQLDPILTAPWHFLSDWFQNKDLTPFHTAHRKSLWEYAVHEPELNKIFNETMVTDSRMIANMTVGP